MARGRMLSKTLGSSRKFAAVGKCAGEFPQLLYAMAISHADDFGRQSGDAFTVKTRVFPSSPRTEEEFEAALVALEQTRLVVRYQHDGETVMEIVKFEEHQQGLHKRTSSKFPEPPPSLPGDSGNPPGIPPQLNLTELNLTEPKGSELNGTALRARFEQFYAAYPKKKSPGQAWKTWQKLKPNDALLEIILGAIARQRTEPDWLKEGGQFIPYPSSWLNDEGWKNQPLNIPQVGTKSAKNLQGIYGD